MSATRSPGGDDPRLIFWRRLKEEIERRQLKVTDLSSATSIPVPRLASMLAGNTGDVLLSDLVALSEAMDIPVASFFD